MTDRIDTVSPLFKARMAGSFYLLSIIAGVSAVTLSGGLSVAANVIGTACYVAVTVLLYDLLKPVDRNISFVAALFSLAGCAISLLKFLHLPAPGISSLVFFGVYCLLLAYLIFRSTFLPKFLSVLLVLTGLGWLTFLSPTLGGHLFVPYLMILGLIGEGALTVWLLVYGVNVQRWMLLQRGH